LPYLSARRVKVVHLIRSNSLAATISYRYAKALGEFHPRADATLPEVVVTLDVDDLRRRLEDHDLAVARARGMIERYRLPRLEVAYEELVARRTETLGRVLRFLDVDESAPLQSGFAKSFDGRHLDRVENADAVQRALSGTRFEWMLDGGRADGG